MTSHERKQLKRILKECKLGRDGMDEYVATLEEPYECVYHFDQIEEIVNSILGSDSCEINKK